ncbi:MAG: histidine kinase [Coriobacteriales bacterium]|nr:histidine kinase [Coriobacteriales bacterium]
MRTRRSVAIDVLLASAVVVLVSTAVFGLFAEVPPVVPLAAVIGLAVLAVIMVIVRFAQWPDHLVALQSQTILAIANETSTYMRQGLTNETAQAVCRIILANTDTAAAVAITDTHCVLGFAGIGQDHHSVGGPIITRATQEVLESARHEVLQSREEIGCPRADCVLKAAIVVPLAIRAEPAGTLKFYYTAPRMLTETQVSMAEGLARLLSTQLELSELERQTELATRMELKALQAQINPHFLFNTINTIASLIRTDPARARTVLREFASFYRRTLETGDELIPLSMELEQTRRYLVLEQARFGDRVSFTDKIDTRLSSILVPAFIIQPIVENSIQHGMRPEGPLAITLDAVAEDGQAIVRITDDGNGISPEILPHVLKAGFGKGLGIALKNVDDRLKGHFGPGSGIAIESEKDKGTVVTLVLADLDQIEKQGARDGADGYSAAR